MESAARVVENVPESQVQQPKQPQVAAASRGETPKILKIALVVVALALVGGAVTAYLHHASRFESTDDCYLAGNVHPVSSRVNGTVLEVLTDDNRIAKADEPLLRIDARDYEVKLDEAKSELVSAEAAVMQAEAQLAQSHGAVAQATASIAQTKAQLDKAILDQKRAQMLLDARSAPQAMYDTAATNHDVAVASVAGAESSRAVSTAMVRAAEANLRVAQARRLTARAAVRDAELQLSYTTIRAPSAGRVGKKSVEVGQRVQPGQALLAVVDADTWVVANFKESQLSNMRPGQAVDVEVDAVADHRFTGTVESFSPGTGAQFSLLPPDNATGNFTKVVQRVPVKIRFSKDSIRGYEDRLAPGLSAVVKVHLRS